MSVANARRDNAAEFMSAMQGFTSGQTMEASSTLSQETLENLYRTNFICRKVCDLYASDMVSAGVEWSCDKDRADLLEKEFSKLQVWGALEQAIKLARLYGGSIVFMGTATSKTDAELNQGEKLTYLRVFDRYEAKPDTANLVPTGARMGEPMSYDISPVITPAGIQADEGRCVRFIGAALPAKLAQREDLWGDSVLQAMASRIRIFDGATQGVGELMKRCYLRSIGISGFWDAMGDEGPLSTDQITKALGMLNQTQTIYGLTVMDANDSFSSQSYSFGGVKDVLDQISQQLAGACDVPLVRLFGMSPAGFSTGESDLKAYYGSILKAQESMLRAPIRRIAEQILTSNGMATEDLDFKFIPLAQQSQMEKMAAAQQGVSTIIAAKDAGLISDARALEEVRRLAETTGLFTTITDADIQALNIPDVPAAPDPAALLAPTGEGVTNGLV